MQISYTTDMHIPKEWPAYRYQHPARWLPGLPRTPQQPWRGGSRPILIQYVWSTCQGEYHWPFAHWCHNAGCMALLWLNASQCWESSRSLMGKFLKKNICLEIMLRNSFNTKIHGLQEQYETHLYAPSSMTICSSRKDPPTPPTSAGMFTPSSPWK